MSAILIVLDKEMQPNGRRIPLTLPKQIIGRSDECDIVLDHRDGHILDTGESAGKNSVYTVSRKHAQISYSSVDGRWAIVNLSSKNTTTLNHLGSIQNNNPTALFSDDRIGLGAVNLLFQIQKEDKTVGATVQIDRVTEDLKA